MNVSVKLLMPLTAFFVIILLSGCSGNVAVEETYRSNDKRVNNQTGAVQYHVEKISVKVEDRTSGMSLSVTVTNDHVNKKSKVGFASRVHPQTISQAETASEMFEAAAKRAKSLADYEVANR